MDVYLAPRGELDRERPTLLCISKENLARALKYDSVPPIAQMVAELKRAGFVRIFKITRLQRAQQQ